MQEKRIKQQQQSGQPITTIDFTPVLELYITVFCKHMFYDPKVERDIQIFLSQDTPSSEEKHKAMFKNQKTSAIQKPPAKHELLFKYRNSKPYGFSLENYRFEILL